MALEQVQQSTSCPGHLLPGKNHWYPLSRRFSGLQNQFGCSEGEKNLLTLPEVTLQFLICSDHNLVTIPTMLPCFPFIPNNDGNLNNVDIKGNFAVFLA